MEQENRSMEQNSKEAEKQQYQAQVKNVTPTHNLFIQMGKAFLLYRAGNLKLCDEQCGAG